MIDAYFTSSPTNSANSVCNQVEWGIYSDDGMTTPWAGSSLITGSTGDTFDYNTAAAVVTSAGASETLFIKANLIGVPGTTVSKTLILSVCESVTIT